MARRYSEAGVLNAAASSTLKTILGITSTAAIRATIYDLTVGTEGTPADQTYQYTAQRTTAAGTSTSVTPTALDPGDPAATATAGSAHSAEPTYTAGVIVLQVLLNQRATYRWVAAPGGELVCPSTAANGIGMQANSVSGGTAKADAVFHHIE